MSETKEQLEDAFEDFEVDGIHKNRNTYRIVFFEEPEQDTVEELINETLNGQVAGLSFTQESRESEKEMVAVAEFRYRE